MPSLPEDRARNLALQLGRTAEDMRMAGELWEALATYKAAYRILPTSLLLWPMAELHLSLRQPLSGLFALHRYVELLGPPPVPPEQQTQDVEALRGKLQAQVARLTVRTDDPSTQLLIDDHPPMEPTIQLDPGPHRIIARLLAGPRETGGPRTVSRDVLLRPGQALQLDLRLRQKAPFWRLSRGRIIAAGVLGGLLLGTLSTAVALTALNGHEYGGGQCSYNGAQYGACVYYFTPGYSLSYSLSALLLGGLAFTLSYPEHH